LGALLVVGAVPALVYVDEPLGGMLAFALAVIGLFVAVVVAERAIPAGSVQAIVDGDGRTLAQLSEGLGLEGQPIYVHDQGNVGHERLFLPASANERAVPILDPDTVTYPGTGETKVGLAVDPPGLILLEAYAAEARPLDAGASLTEAEAFLDGLYTTHDLARSLTVTKTEDGLRVRFRPQAVEVPCREQPLDPICERTGCALCQAAGCALSRSLGRPLTVGEADVREDTVTLSLVPDQPKAERPGEATATETAEAGQGGGGSG
jgi:hypothetical protein